MQTVSTTKVSIQVLKEMSTRMQYGIVKAVVDINKKVMVIDADMHADQEQLLLDSGSNQYDLWGINLHPGYYGTDGFIEYDSMINLRPTQGNLSRSVDNIDTQKRIKEIVDSLVTNE